MQKRSLVELTVSDLVTYCQRQKINFVPFEDWNAILEATRYILYVCEVGLWGFQLIGHSSRRKRSQEDSW